MDHEPLTLSVPEAGKRYFGIGRAASSSRCHWRDPNNSSRRTAQSPDPGNGAPARYRGHARSGSGRVMCASPAIASNNKNPAAASNAAGD
jgi:hypothetical protein